MKKYLIFIPITVIILFFIGYWLIFLPLESFSEKQVQFSVVKGERSKDIALNLEKEGLIKWDLVFRTYLLVKGITGNLKAGEYFLSPSMNITEIAVKLVRGETINVEVIIPEGFTVKQIEEKLDLKLPGENLEGFLFPDTYQFSLNFSGEEVVKKMQENFKKKITPDLESEIERQGKTLEEVITMASLIEKEVSSPEDKELVSGILWKRLAVGMRLQVDATIAYILEAAGWSFAEMRREIALARGIDSPYNTYQYSDLPAGPICNPGLESIKAALFPQESDYWYYLSTPAGETIFSQTLQEHNLAKAQYLQ